MAGKLRSTVIPSLTLLTAGHGVGVDVEEAKGRSEKPHLGSNQTLARLVAWLLLGIAVRENTIITDFLRGKSEEKLGGRARLLLGAGSPIAGWIRDAPEGRSGLNEFHCNLSRSRHLLLHIDHVALFLFPAGYVLHEEPLLTRYLLRQDHQRAVRIDNQRLCPFRKLRAFLGRAVNDNRNGQLNPLAPPHF